MLYLLLALCCVKGSEETRAKIALAHKGRSRSEETRSKLSASQRARHARKAQDAQTKQA